MVPDPVIRLESLTKHYYHPLLPWRVKVRALTGLSLEVHRGEVFGLLGPNGSGKSTTIKLIMGLNFPTDGRVQVLGRSPHDLEVRRRIGYLPEESYLYPFLNPVEILDFYGRLFSLRPTERHRRIDQLLAFVGLTAERRRPVGEFSKGMQRRVALAQCLINDPDIIIMDEPTAGMDAIGIAEIKELIRRLEEKGKTVLMCSHRMADVEDVCGRLTILYGGRAQVTGRIRDLVQAEKLTQVTASMREETVSAVRDVIRGMEGEDADVTVSPVLEKLERYFLQVVEEARQRQEETSGVGVSSLEKLEFLSGSRTVSGSQDPGPASEDQ